MSLSLHAHDFAAYVAPAAVRPRGVGLWSRIALSLAVHRASAALNRLDDRTLADIGIPRERIPAIVRAHLSRR